MYWIIALLTFISEILLFYGLGRTTWLYLQLYQFSYKWLWTAIVLTLAISLWGLFMSPDANYRLNLWMRILIVFLASILISISLIKAGDTKIGWILLTAGTLLLTAGQYVIERGL